MKKIIIILCIINIGFAKAQYTLIPDINFEQALIDLGIDSENTLDGQVLTNDINTIDYLDVFNRGISNFTGIEGFINLKILRCSDNLFTTLDFSSNVNLETIECSYNESLASINLINLINLEYLLINVVPSLIELDLHDNINLKILSLGEFGCSPNFFPYQLSTLDLSNNINLEQLYCIGMSTFNSINLSNCTSLKNLTFRCNNDSVNLDLDDCVSLENLHCSNAHLTTLNLQNNINLKYLNCGDVSDFGGEFNSFESLDLSNNINLIELKAHNIFFDMNNPYYEIDLSNNPLLEKVDLAYNFLNDLNIANGNNKNLNTLILSTISLYDRLECIQVDNQDIADIANADQNNWIERDKVVYSVDCETVSVSNEILSSIVSISPNPINAVFTINVTNDLIQEISIFNFIGQSILTANTNIIDISKYEKGVYYIKILTTTGNKFHEKIIKK